MSLRPVGLLVRVLGWKRDLQYAADQRAESLPHPAEVSGVSNAFNVQLSPVITVSPTSIGVTLNQGGTTTRTVTIGNSGGFTLNWNLASSAAFAEVASEGPVFTGTRLSQRKPKPQPQDPAQAYVEIRQNDEVVESGAADVALASALTESKFQQCPHP
jgi:hypothetical protein